MNKRRRSSGRRLMAAGLLLLAAAFCLAAFNIRETLRAAEDAAAALAQISLPSQQADHADEETPEEEIPDYLLNPEMEMPVQELDGEPYIGVLEIPALGLRLPVISQWSDARLRKAPCRYSGSVYTDDMVLAGHNYKTHFGPLTRISVDDEIRFIDADGNVFCYRTVEVAVLEATAIEEMKSDNPGLTLFTCTLGGRTRFAVRAVQEHVS